MLKVILKIDKKNLTEANKLSVWQWLEKYIYVDVPV